MDISTVTEDYFNNKLLTYAKHFTACKHDATVFEERITIKCQVESKSISLRKGEATITIIGSVVVVVAVESSEQ